MIKILPQTRVLSEIILSYSVVGYQRKRCVETCVASRTVPRFYDNEVSIFGRFFDHNEIANASRSLLRNGTLIECLPERKRECRAVAPLARNKSVLPAMLFLFTYFASEMMQML